MTYTTAEPCVDVMDQAYLQDCPVDCIDEGARMLSIHPEECLDCGACEPVCPVEAIYDEDDLPAQWAQDASINSDFFLHTIVGSPGGGAKLGAAGIDHPAWPRWTVPLSTRYRDAPTTEGA